MKTKSKTVVIQASADTVFSYMDKLSNTGMHMSKSSMPMLGNKLELEQLSENDTGLHAKFRWYGKIVGLTLDFTVVVTKWIKNQEKVWETIGKAKMIILGWYQMGLIISPLNAGKAAKVKLSIVYTRPNNIFFQLLSFLLAPFYANWCLNNILIDSKNCLEANIIQENHEH
jgi:hypothetical protein